MQEEFARILTGVVHVVHNQTSHLADTDRAIHTIIRAGKVLAAINRALTMAVCFVDSDGYSTAKGAPRGMAQ